MKRVNNRDATSPGGVEYEPRDSMLLYNRPFNHSTRQTVEEVLPPPTVFSDRHTVLPTKVQAQLEHILTDQLSSEDTIIRSYRVITNFIRTLEKVFLTTTANPGAAVVEVARTFVFVHKSYAELEDEADLTLFFELK